MPDDGLATLVDVHVLYGHLLLSLATVAVERLQEGCVGPAEFVGLV